MVMLIFFSDINYTLRVLNQKALNVAEDISHATISLRLPLSVLNPAIKQGAAVQQEPLR